MAENGNNPVPNSKPQGQNQGYKNHNYYRKKNYHSNKPYNNDRKEGNPQPASSENVPKQQVQRQPQPQPRPQPQPQPKAVQPQNQQTGDKKPYEKQSFNNYRHYNKERRPLVVQVETIDDIRKDIVRIEKEIYLEIEEIKTIKV
ncbi:MAG: hypothetical protein WCY62_09555 [Clostridia bacterium]